jgi:hypothetical protein
MSTMASVLMQKYILILMVVFAPILQGKAQIERGSFSMSGGVNFSNTRYSDILRYSFPKGSKNAHADIDFAAFFARNWSIGVLTSFALQNSVRGLYQDFSSGPILKYYWMRNKFSVVPELSYQTGRSKMHISGFGYELERGKSKGLNLGVSALYFVNESVAISCSYLYGHKESWLIGGYFNGTSIVKGSSVTIDLQFFLRKSLKQQSTRTSSKGLEGV